MQHATGTQVLALTFGVLSRTSGRTAKPCYFLRFNEPALAPSFTRAATTERSARAARLVDACASARSAPVVANLCAEAARRPASAAAGGAPEAGHATTARASPRVDRRAYAPSVRPCRNRSP